MERLEIKLEVTIEDERWFDGKRDGWKRRLVIWLAWIVTVRSLWMRLKCFG